MRRPAALIRLSEEERKALQSWAADKLAFWSRSGKSEQRMVERARIILLADEGQTNEQIAAGLKTRTARVSKWRQRFGAKRLAGLGDATRSGNRPRSRDRKPCARGRR